LGDSTYLLGVVDVRYGAGWSWIAWGEAVAVLREERAVEARFGEGARYACNYKATSDEGLMFLFLRRLV
jgi:hypothetical protein